MLDISNTRASTALTERPYSSILNSLAQKSIQLSLECRKSLKEKGAIGLCKDNENVYMYFPNFSIYQLVYNGKKRKKLE